MCCCDSVSKPLSLNLGLSGHGAEMSVDTDGCKWWLIRPIRTSNLCSTSQRLHSQTPVLSCGKLSPSLSSPFSLHKHATNKYKKFELMLTGRTKAYSSSYPQAVTHRGANRAQRKVTSFQPKHVNNYATPPTPVPWRRLVNERKHQKIHKTPYFGVQGHPRSLNSVPIESQYTISY